MTRVVTRSWTLQHTVENPHVLRPGRVLVVGNAHAGHLAWQLARLGAVVQIHAGPGDRCGTCRALLYTNGTCPNCDRARAVDGCRSCTAPMHLHCPGCESCSPGYQCAPGCNAGLDEVDRAGALLDAWEREHEGPTW